ncbi:hypothetical protein HYS47_02660 [Candidatus Woesearchaeota archaeon]|nr:hypothetical protein [Candidatus Woesearchaeota archaeon]
MGDGLKEKVAKPTHAKSLDDKVVDNATDHSSSPLVEPVSVEAPQQARISWLLPRTPREGVILAAGGGLLALATEVVPPAIALAQEYGTRAVHKAQPLIDVVSQHHGPALIGALALPLAGEAYTLYSKRRLARFRTLGLLSTAGGAAGIGISAALPALEELVSDAGDAAERFGTTLMETAPEWAPVTVGGIAGATAGALLLPKVLNRILVDGQGNRLHWRYNTARIVGGIGGGIVGAYTPRMIEAAWSFGSRIRPSLEAFVNVLPEIGVAGGGALGMLGMSRILVGQPLTRGETAAALIIGGAAGIGLLNGGLTPAADFLNTIGGYSVGGLLGAVMLTLYAQRQEQRRGKRSGLLVSYSRIVIGAGIGIGTQFLIHQGARGAYSLFQEGLRLGLPAAKSAYHTLAPYGEYIAIGAGIVGVAAGVGIAFAKSPRLRQTTSSAIYSMGRKAASAGRYVRDNAMSYVMHPVSSALDLVTPSHEDTVRYNGRYLQRLLGAGGLLAAIGAGLEPTYNAVASSPSTAAGAAAVVFFTALAGVNHLLKRNKKEK